MTEPDSGEPNHGSVVAWGNRDRKDSAGWTARPQVHQRRGYSAVDLGWIGWICARPPMTRGGSSLIGPRILVSGNRAFIVRSVSARPPRGDPGSSRRSSN
jgi:hypothetical protein